MNDLLREHFWACWWFGVIVVIGIVEAIKAWRGGHKDD